MRMGAADLRRCTPDLGGGGEGPATGSSADRWAGRHPGGEAGGFLGQAADAGGAAAGQYGAIDVVIAGGALVVGECLPPCAWTGGGIRG
jgi:hypothetical protein